MKKTDQPVDAQIDQSFGQDETQRRFEAALRGARAATPHPMKEFIGKGKAKRTDQGQNSP
jgi:hypothetical protein